jgi:hypothetical protein
MLVEICREDYKLLKRDFDLFATVQAQKVDASFQRENPTIQEFLWLYSLATEVIDYQGATIGFHLKWGFVESSGFRPLKISVLEKQFASNHNHGSLDLDPAAIVFNDGTRSFDRTMCVRIEYPNHLRIDFDRIGNPDRTCQC